MKKREKASWNGKPNPPKLELVLMYETTRKLTVASEAMDTMVAQEDLTHFLNNPENAQGLNCLVEDVRYALMEYQVCAPERPNSIIANICLRFHYSRRFTTRAVS